MQMVIRQEDLSEILHTLKLSGYCNRFKHYFLNVRIQQYGIYYAH